MNYVAPFKQVHGIVNSLLMAQVMVAILRCGTNNTDKLRNRPSKESIFLFQS